jgi:type II secretory pathway component PulL
LFVAGVLAHLKDGPEVDRTIYFINLFPNKAKIPTNMSELAARIKNSVREQEDIKLLRRFNEVAALVEALETLPDGNPLRDHA